MTEQWRPVVGYEGLYEVSDLGRVRTVARVDRLNHRRPSVILKCATDKNGYRQFLACGDRRRQVKVHRAVLLAFVGAAPQGRANCLHADGNPANNALVNLRWGSASENQMDAVGHGTHYRATRTHCPRGHEYTPSNTYFNRAANGRMCRTCNNAASRRARKAAA